MSTSNQVESSEFYLYGKKHFTRTGWEEHRTEYEEPDILTLELDLSESVYMITGANSGIGREVAQYLAGQNATVFVLCRNRAKAEAAVAEIIAATGNSRLHILHGDMGLESDVRRCMQEFAAHWGCEIPRLDGLVCNAGSLLREKKLTSEGVEATFASHLLFGTYLLGRLAMPSLQATPGSRFIAMSSGGMYNFAFPSWDVATSTESRHGSLPPAIYNGQVALSYASRGKVLLCERWAEELPGVKVVSCHPGWTDTPGVKAAYGDAKKHLEPMRTLWEGAEGIAWLCVAPSNEIISGSLYLDRKPQDKHIPGSNTKNTPAQIEAMIRQLDDWSNGRRPEYRELVAGPGVPEPRSGETMLGASQHASPPNEVAALKSWRCLFVLAVSFIVALAFGGLGVALASQDVGVFMLLGGTFGLMFGLGFQFRRPRRIAGPEQDARETMMDGVQNGKSPSADMEDASTAAGSSFADEGSFATSMSASLVSSSRS